MTSPIPENESARLEALHGCEMLDTGPDGRFDSFVSLASRLSGSPIAALSLIDRDRQWFKSRIGFTDTESPRDISFCAHAILDPDEVLVVEDAARDPRFAANPFVTGAANIRFYAGAPVLVADHQPVGVLCVLDREPKTMPAAARQSLRDLAAGAASLLEAHRHAALMQRFTGESGCAGPFGGHDGLGADLRRALANDEFHLVWQPFAELHMGPDTARGAAPAGFEALLRWNRGASARPAEETGPGIFIPVAEATGLIRNIDRWVLRNACTAAAGWRDGHGIAINVSADWFRDDALPELVASVLDESRLDPARLEVEITERMLIGNHERGLRIIRQIQSLGASVALDDFGSGYASLAYLMSFPFDKIKLDRAFISELGVNPRAELITRSVLKLARQLATQICAEGVETEAQLAFLRAEGCDLAQGYLLGRPIPVPVHRLEAMVESVLS